MFLAGAFLTIIYLLPGFTLVFLGEAKAPQAKEGSPVMVGSVALLALSLSLAGGFLIISVAAVRAGGRAADAGN